MNLPALSIEKTFENHPQPVLFVQDEKVVYANIAAVSFTKHKFSSFEKHLPSLPKTGKITLNWKNTDFLVAIEDFKEGTLYTFEESDPQQKLKLTNALSGRLRHHITNLSSATEVLEGKLSAPQLAKETKSQLATLNKATLSLFRLTKQLELFGGDFSALYPKETINLSLICRSIAKDFSPLAEKALRRFDYAIEKNSALVYSNTNLLAYIISALLSNAIKFSPEQGLLNLSFKEKQGLFSLSITNEGESIPENLSQFFSLHFQEDLPDSKAGLGLDNYLIAQSVQYLNGKIVALPKEDGGLQVTLTFPPLSISDIDPQPELEIENLPAFRIEEPKNAGFVSYEDTHSLLIVLAEVLPLSCFETID